MVQPEPIWIVGSTDNRRRFDSLDRCFANVPSTTALPRFLEPLADTANTRFNTLLSALPWLYQPLPIPGRHHVGSKSPLPQARRGARERCLSLRRAMQQGRAPADDDLRKSMVREALEIKVALSAINRQLTVFAATVNRKSPQEDVPQEVNREP